MDCLHSKTCGHDVCSVEFCKEYEEPVYADQNKPDAERMDAYQSLRTEADDLRTQLTAANERVRELERTPADWPGCMVPDGGDGPCREYLDVQARAEAAESKLAKALEAVGETPSSLDRVGKVGGPMCFRHHQYEPCTVCREDSHE